MIKFSLIHFLSIYLSIISIICLSSIYHRYHLSPIIHLSSSLSSIYLPIHLSISHLSSLYHLSLSLSVSIYHLSHSLHSNFPPAPHRPRSLPSPFQVGRFLCKETRTHPVSFCILPFLSRVLFSVSPPFPPALPYRTPSFHPVSRRPEPSFLSVRQYSGSAAGDGMRVRAHTGRWVRAAASAEPRSRRLLLPGVNQKQPQ